MSKYSDAERAAILAETQENLRRADEEAKGGSHWEPCSTVSNVVEINRMDQWRRDAEMQETKRRLADAERRGQEKQFTDVYQRMSALEGQVQDLRDELATSREEVLQIVAEGVGKLLKDVRSDVTRTVDAIKEEMSRLRETKSGNMPGDFADSDKVIDWPYLKQRS
jgi:septal ring factor EnvC (AmiA/AmiB activator)